MEEQGTLRGTLAPSLNAQCNASFIDETIVAILIISTHYYKVNTFIQLLGYNRDCIYNNMNEEATRKQ